MKPKILQFITSLKYGGTESFVFDVVKGLKEKFEFTVGYIKEEGVVAEKIREFGVPVLRFSNFIQLLNHLIKNKYAIIHTHLYRANIVGRVVGKVAGVPIIISSQRSIDRWKKKYHICVDRLTSHFSTAILSNSQTARELLNKREKIPLHKIFFIPPGIDLNPKRYYKKENFGFKKDDFVCGFFGRLHQEKGGDLLPTIISHILRLNNRVKFLIVGDGPLYSYLEKFIESRRLNDSVKLTGYLENASDLLSCIDVLLLPSFEESFPRIALEAMKYEKAIVGFYVGGIDEVVKDGVTGILVEYPDIENFAKSVIWLYGRPSLLKEMGVFARDLVKEYNLVKMLAKVENFYIKLLEEKKLWKA